MKINLFIALIFFFHLTSFCQTGNVKSLAAVPVSGSVEKAVVDITWLGTKPVKLFFNNEEFFFTEEQKQRLSFYSGNPYVFKVVKPGKTYIYKANVYFDKGIQAITVALINDSLIVTFPSRINNELKNEMIRVDGGVFVMGCNGKPDSNCVNIWNQQKISLSSFYISKYDITQSQWEAVMGYNPSHFKNCSDCPVEMVSWNDIQKFITKLNETGPNHYRLPTEAEWEFAARGGNKSNGYNYAGSNVLDSVAWYSGNSDNHSHPVGQKKANELGLFDMTGNVMQWCADWYGEEYLSRRPGNNPLGAESGTYRVVRGSAWISLKYDCRVLYRDKVYPGISDGFDGFRLVQDF